MSSRRERDLSPSASSTCSRRSASSTGSQFMVPWESVVGNEARNVPLQLPQRRYTVGEMLRKQAEIEQQMTTDIRASFTSLSLQEHGVSPTASTTHFLVIHFGKYYTNFEGSHPAEFCIADFSIRDGFNTCYSKMLDPGSIPFGFRSDFIAAAKEKGYELPGFNPEMAFDSDCLGVIEDMMYKYPSVGGEPGIIYTARTEMDTVKQCLEFAAKKCGRFFNCKVYPLSRLIELLLIEGDNIHLKNGKITKMTFVEEDAIALINKGGYDYVQELACDHHADPDRVEKISFCSMNIVKRWIYNCMGLMTRMHCCPMHINRHIPRFQNTGFYRIEKAEELPWVDHDGKSVSETESVVSGSSARSFPIFGSESANLAEQESIASTVEVFEDEEDTETEDTEDVDVENDRSDYSFVDDGLSIASSAKVSWSGSDFSTVSKAKGAFLSEAAKASLKQSIEIVEHGILPHTRFVESNKTFWDTCNIAKKLPDPPGRKQTGRGRGREWNGDRESGRSKGTQKAPGEN